MTAAQLRRLHELVHAAQAVTKRPFEEGETSRPIEFFTDHLQEEGWLLGWILVAAIRAKHPELFGFYDEQRLHQRRSTACWRHRSPFHEQDRRRRPS